MQSLMYRGYPWIISWNAAMWRWNVPSRIVGADYLSTEENIWASSKVNQQRFKVCKKKMLGIYIYKYDFNIIENYSLRINML